MQEELMKIPFVRLGLILMLVFAVPDLMPQTGPVIPAWVKPGTTVAYDGVSAFVNNGRFSQAVQVVMTTRVTSVSGNAVSGITRIQTVGTPLASTHTWTCTAAGSCRSDMPGFSGKFWVDPAHPVESVRGPNGEPYILMGRAPYAYGGRKWSGATLSYQNPATGWQYVLTFDTATGLILAYAETSPSQQVHTYFRSMNTQ
jgi:hypothetical protein